MASGNIVVMPSKGANIQTAFGLPNVALQASGATPYPQLGAQQLGASTSIPQQVPQRNPLQEFLDAETKVPGNTIDSGLSGVLLLFSLLEFCITVSFAHFGCQTNCCGDNQPTLVFMPYQVNSDATVTCETNQRFPPTYNNVVTEP